MSFRTAMDLVDDDMPDGAFFALAHEMAGLEYGDGFDELIAEEDPGPRPPRPPRPPKTIKCDCCKKKFRTRAARRQHRRDAHPDVAVKS